MRDNSQRSFDRQPIDFNQARLDIDLSWQQDFCARLIDESISRLNARIERTAAGADTAGGGTARNHCPDDERFAQNHHHHRRKHHEHPPAHPHAPAARHDFPMPLYPEIPGQNVHPALPARDIPAPSRPALNELPIPPLNELPPQSGNTPPPDHVPMRPGYRKGVGMEQPPEFTPPNDKPLTTPNPSDFTGDQIGFPPRAQGRQMTGSEFMTQVLHADPSNPKVKGLTGVEREQAILEQIEKGNVPDFLRHPKTITVTDKNGNQAQLQVMPDYLAIGTNEDFVRVPVTPLLAKTIADRYGFELPTQKVCNDIYAQADKRLTGVGLVGSREDTNYMDGNGFFYKHNQIIERNLGNTSSDALVAGHKKDIIISRYAGQNPDRLDFYGLFDGKGKPIQGSGGGPHDNTYVDYSHGARFVSQDVIVNGKHMRYDDVLRDPRYADLLSNEGAYDASNIYKQPANQAYAQLVDTQHPDINRRA